MNNIFYTFSTLIFIFSSCNSPLIPQKKEAIAPKLEMIFGKEKKELEAYIHFLDSLEQINSNLEIDTSLYNPGSFIITDSLGNTNRHSIILDVIEQKRTQGQGKSSSKSILDLHHVLKGNIKYESYDTYLSELKKTKHLVVFKNIACTQPRLISQKQFQGGTILSLMKVIDLKNHKIVKYRILQAQNSEQIKTSSNFGLSEISLQNDLWENYHKARLELIKTNLK
jgi:hypothetical protein